LKIIAYKTADDGVCDQFRIVPASRERDWMNATPNRFAYRCLPLVIANQMGWTIGCPVSFEAIWDGRMSPDGIRVRLDEGAPAGTQWKEYIVGHFGSGILTFVIPFLFRTAADHGLYVRGPTNTVKRGAVALDAYVETQWHDLTFTMNWKLTDPGLCVRFEQGEPMCMIAPYDAAALQDVTTEKISICRDPPLRDALAAKIDSRNKFNADPDRGSSWQKNYFQGENASGERHDGHLSKLRLTPFSAN
jgi:hypothetical protein